MCGVEARQQEKRRSSVRSRWRHTKKGLKLKQKTKRGRKGEGSCWRGNKEKNGVEFRQKVKRRKSVCSRCGHTKKGVELKLKNKRKEKRVKVCAGGTQRNVWG